MDFISFSPDYWDGPRHNRHYFCEELSKSHRVLFCSPPFYIVTLMRQLGRGTLSRSGVRRLKPNLVNYVPSKFLFTNHRIPRLNDWTKEWRLATIRRLMHEDGFNEPVLIIWHPYFREMADCFEELPLVYYVYDQYSGYTGGNAQESNPNEQELLRRADVVFVLSRELYGEKQKWAKNIHHLPNAVDFELFSRARDSSTDVPSDIAAIPGPRIGYIGTMNEKVDLALLEHVATARPRWSIVLVGRQNYVDTTELARFHALASRPNVHWLGPRPYDSVPAYIKGLDVCMMCYVVNEWTYFGDPSKMHEYLASGKPTIGTGLSSIREFEDVIAIPACHEGWVQAIEDGLRERNGDQRKRRIETARLNSYRYRVEKATRIIAEAVEKRR